MKVSLIKKACSPEVFCKKGVFKNFVKVTGKHLCWSFFLNKISGLQSTTLLKKRLHHKCFPVNFAKFLRTAFIEQLRWLLLTENISTEVLISYSIAAQLNVVFYVNPNKHEIEIYWKNN